MWHFLQQFVPGPQVRRAAKRFIPFIGRRRVAVTPEQDLAGKVAQFRTRGEIARITRARDYEVEPVGLAVDRRLNLAVALRCVGPRRRKMELEVGESDGALDCIGRRG